MGSPRRSSNWRNFSLPSIMASPRLLSPCRAAADSPPLFPWDTARWAFRLLEFTPIDWAVTRCFTQNGGADDVDKPLAAGP